MILVILYLGFLGAVANRGIQLEREIKAHQLEVDQRLLEKKAAQKT